MKPVKPPRINGRVPVLSAQEAVNYIPDEATLCVLGAGGGILEATTLITALADKYKQTQTPRNLSIISPTGLGDRADRGISPLAQEGLVKWALCGHWGQSPRISDLAEQNKIIAYNYPQGVLTQTLRAAAAHQPGIISDIGIGTFVDPRQQGPREFMRALADNGISMLGVPEEFGGIPADYVTQMLALMEVSKCGAPAFLITNGQCIHSMRRFGSAEQLRKTAESTLETGDPAYALALTEPGAGSDNNSATTTYTRKNGKVYINGQKTFITGAKEYPYMLVLARDPQPKDPKKAFTLWWVDSSKPGIKINPLHKIGWHMLSTCEVYLDNVEVEESDMVGEEGMGFLNVMYNFEMERLINAARSTGFAECAFEDAARYANQRIAFGKPIGHNQMIQEKLALMAIKIDNMRNMVLKVAWQADQHQSLRTSAALAKLYCARTAMEVIDDAIQIMGGLGYTDEARVSRFWRDVRCERIGGGTDEIMIYVAGRQILKDYQNK